MYFIFGIIAKCYNEKKEAKGGKNSIPLYTLSGYAFIKLIWSAYSRPSEAQLCHQNLCAVWELLKENEKNFNKQEI